MCERMKIFDLTSAARCWYKNAVKELTILDPTGQIQNRSSWGISAGNTQAAVPAGQAATDGHDFGRINVIK